MLHRPISHPHVVHPRSLVEVHRQTFLRANDRLLDWVSENILASMLMFDVALLVPLLAIPLSNNVKITLGVVSGSWIQWWALHALQRSQVKGSKLRQAKADSDHDALTHIAIQVDRILTVLNNPTNEPVQDEVKNEKGSTEVEP